MAALDFPDNPSVNDVFTAGDFSWKWSGTAWDVVGSTQAPGATAIADLTDVQLTDLADNQILLYNSVTTKWENVDTDVLTGTNYDVLDGGTANSNYIVTVNGGGASG